MLMITRTFILDYMQQTTTHYCNLYGSQLHVHCAYQLHE